MMLSEGCVALITGGGGAIGRAIALRLAREGASIAVADLDVEQAQATGQDVEAIGRECLAVHLDVTSLQNVRDAIGAVLDRFGRVDILVNSFGVNHPIVPLIDLDEDIWERVLDVNLTGVFRCCKVVGERMREQRAGKIANIASISGEVPPLNLAAYNSSKAGVIALTKTLALELAPYNVQVNAVCPGPVDTPLLRRAWTGRAERRGVTVDEFYDYVRGNIPARRLVKPEDVAAAVAFLVSSDTTMVVGTALDVAGGMLVQPY